MRRDQSSKDKAQAGGWFTQPTGRSASWAKKGWIDYTTPGPNPKKAGKPTGKQTSVSWPPLFGDEAMHLAV